MTASLTRLSESAAVQLALRQVDSELLARELTGDANIFSGMDSVARLRVASIVSLNQLFADSTNDFLHIVSLEPTRLPPAETAMPVFRKWAAYLDALFESGQNPSPDELLFFAASGTLANRQIEVRSVLREPQSRATLNSVSAETKPQNWIRWVRESISSAIVFLVMQDDHQDVAKAGLLIKRLSDNQKLFEDTWLQAVSRPSHNALCLLGLYHLAQAVSRVSEFLLIGSIGKNGRTVHDFAPELGRLLTRAEEYICASGDLETLFWLDMAGLSLIRLRSDSIWVQATGISERLDTLIMELASSGRHQPVFSLLPSQQEAIRQSLLDPSRVAIVLQMPTSAGKTLLAEFAIVQAFEAYKRNARVVYVVPTRALATQIRRTLTEDLQPLGISVSAAGSAFEEDPYELNLLEDTDGVVVATPEKLDLMLRSHPEWFDTLRLIVVDEAHLLKDHERGVRLELLLANIRREQPKARLLLLTPFMENSREIANWLGDAKSTSIDVHWRPSRIILGLCKIAGTGKKRAIKIEWKEPYDPQRSPNPTTISTNVSSKDVNSSLDKVVYLASRFRSIGTILAMFGLSRTDAEAAASRVADEREKLGSKLNPALRMAIALAKNDYGPDSLLARCLERGVAFHHSALSPTLRYLIEDQIRNKLIRFVAATSTLAQGMNFPVSMILVHSVDRPYGKGAFSPSEFWNIAGRAGRTGMVDRGIVLFVNPQHEEKWHKYSKALSEPLTSALLQIIGKASNVDSLKDMYREFPECRPLLQYLAHAAANLSPGEAIVNLEELLRSSLASRQAKSAIESQALRSVARKYLTEIMGKPKGYLKAADQTGLGSFSFDSLFAAISGDPLLRAGPSEVLGQKQNGILHLVEALRWLPELSLGLTMGEGTMDTAAIANVVQGWMDGKTIYELSSVFPGDDEAIRGRRAATYLNSQVSQNMAWGAHAYLRSWLMRQPEDSAAISSSDRMLAAYLQYGVHSPEGTIASLLGVPRQFAEATGVEFRRVNGQLKPEDANKFKDFMNSADETLWASIVKGSTMSETIDPGDVRSVWREMNGLR